MSENGNAEIVQSFYTNFVAGDIDAVLALLSPDFALVYSGPSIIPSAGKWDGHKAFEAGHKPRCKAICRPSW